MDITIIDGNSETRYAIREFNKHSQSGRRFDLKIDTQEYATAVAQLIADRFNVIVDVGEFGWMSLGKGRVNVSNGGYFASIAGIDNRFKEPREISVMVSGQRCIIDATDLASGKTSLVDPNDPVERKRNTFLLRCLPH